MTKSNFSLGVDLSDHDVYTAGTPHALFSRLRNECPVYWNERRDGSGGFWCITKFEDIASINKDFQRFTSTRGVSMQVQPEQEAAGAADVLMIYMDPPRHTRLRSVINYAFTPKRLASLEPVIRYHAGRALDAVMERGECNFFDVAATLPIGMISHLMGIPDEMHAQVLNWTNRTFGRDDPEYAGGIEDSAAAYQEMFQYAHGLCEQRRKHPTDDLVSALANAKIDGEGLTDGEISWLFFLLLGAGNDTTRTLILNCVNVFLKVPGLFDKLKADPAFLPSAIEEVLRLEPSVRGMGRTATQDTVVRGVPIKAGEQVYLWYSSGNRDEDAFPDADQFRLDRSGSIRHQAFGGGGVHYCVGAPLARLQTKIVFEEIFSRIPDIQLAGQPVYLRTDGFMNSFKKLPVRYTAGKPRNLGRDAIADAFRRKSP